MLRVCVVGALVLAPVVVLAGPSGPSDDSAVPAPAPAPAQVAPAPAQRVRRRAPARRVRRAARPRRSKIRPGRRTVAYSKALSHWREPPPRAEVSWAEGYRDLTLYSVNWNERVTVRPIRADGTLDPEALAAIRRVLRDRRSGESADVDPRLVKLIYRVADHFDAPQLTVISGYRTPRRGRGGYHSHGAAIDFLVPGVPDADVASFARTLGHCGVGVYSTSGFVHLDARDRSYFWRDASGPGQRGRIRQIEADEAWVADHRWSPASDAPSRRERPDGVQVIRGPGRTRASAAPTDSIPEPEVVEAEDEDGPAGEPGSPL